MSFYNSPGLLAEENHLFLAEDLYDESLEAEENERIEIVQLPVARLDETIPRAARRQDAHRAALVQALPALSRPCGTEVAGQGTLRAGRSRPRGHCRPPLEAHAFEHLVLDFLAYLEFERGLSRNTLEAYRSDLLQFGRFLEERGIQAVAARGADLADFLAALGGSEGRSASPATIHRKAACLRSFYRHLRREGVLDTRPDGQPHRAAARPQAAPGAHARGGQSTARTAPGHRAHRPARPRAARADVRLRPAGLRGDRAGGEGHRPGGAGAAGPGQGLQGASGAGGPYRRRGGAPLPRARALAARGRPVRRRTCSSTSAAARSRARASTRSCGGTRSAPAWPTG